MIGSVVPHSGDMALARHLVNSETNQVIVTRTQGVPGGSVADCLANLRLMATGCRTAKPLAHAHANPSRSYTEAEWERYWAEFERVFALPFQPFIEVQHTKFGANRVASHRHRVYLRATAKGKAIALSHSFLRSERVSRWAEFTNGEALTRGRFNRAVEKALRADGQTDVADAMKKAGLLDGDIPIATRPHQRQMTERSADISTDEACRRIWRAWSRSETGADFAAALREVGLSLATGEKVVVAVTARGAVHPLRRALRMGAAEARTKAVSSAELAARLAGLTIPSAATARAQATPVATLGAYQVTGAERSMRPARRQASSRQRDDGARPARTVRSSPPAAAHGETPHMARDQQFRRARQAAVAVGAVASDKRSTAHAAYRPRRSKEVTAQAPSTRQRHLGEARQSAKPGASRTDAAKTAVSPASRSSTHVRPTREAVAPERRHDVPAAIVPRDGIPAEPHPLPSAPDAGRLPLQAELAPSQKKPNDRSTPADGRRVAAVPKPTALAQPADRQTTRTRGPLTAAQEAAVAHFLAAFEGGAAIEVAAMRQQAEAAADRALAAARRAAAKAAARELQADWARPSIGRPGWKDEFKAALAGLPAEVGARIRWVETAVADRKTVTLRSGERVFLMSDRATGSAPTSEVATVMIEHAIAQGWRSVVFSGGTRDWCEAAARLATRRGLRVENAELMAIVASERELIRLENVLAKWRAARDAVAEEPDSAGLRREFVAAIRALRSEPSWRVNATRFDRARADYDFLQLDLREASLEGTEFHPHEFERFLAGGDAGTNVRYD